MAAFLLTRILDDDEQPPPKQRNRKWIQRREEHGVYHQLVQELVLEDPEAYRNFFAFQKSKKRRKASCSTSSSVILFAFAP